MNRTHENLKLLIYFNKVLSRKNLFILSSLHWTVSFSVHSVWLGRKIDFYFICNLLITYNKCFYASQLFESVLWVFCSWSFFSVYLLVISSLSVACKALYIHVCMISCSVVSDSLWSHGPQPPSLLFLWDSPGWRIRE